MEKFTEIPAEKSALIDRSRKTNQIYMEISALLEQVRELSEIGRDDDLDPPCVALFKKAIGYSVELQQANQGGAGRAYGERKMGLRKGLNEKNPPCGGFFNLERSFSI